MKHEREVTVLQVLGDSTFVKMNLEVYGGTSRLIGPSKHAELTLLANNDFLKGVLPTVLGIDKASGKWQDTVQNYLYAFGLDVPKGGTKLDVGFTVNMNDSTKKANIIALSRDVNKKFETDEELLLFLIGYNATKESNVPEIELYKYVTFNSPIDYYRYVYCLHHNRVANVQADVKNSTRIEYFMTTALDKATEKRNQYLLEKSIRKVINKVEADKEFANNLYSVLNITSGDIIDKAIAFSEMCKIAPNKVMKAAKNKNLMTIAVIENYIRAGILQRVLGSTMITETNDASVIIGQTLSAAITYFNNQDNNIKLTQYKTAYISLLNK